MNNLLAQQITVGGQTIKGPLVGISTIGDVVNKITVFLVPIAAVILLFVLISGGYDLINSQGTPEKLKTAQGKITAGLIGFGLLVGSYVIVKLISFIFGLGQGIL